MPITTREPEALESEQRKAPPSLFIREGTTLLLDERQLERHRCLTVTAGLMRVAASRLSEEALQANPVTLGFLQPGDQLPLDLVFQRRLHLRAIRTTRLEETSTILPASDGLNLHHWTLEMLLIRNLSDAEQRIRALMQLLIHQLGCRRGAWYELPLVLTHAELAELCGHTRATVTRQFSRWRDQGLLEQNSGTERRLRLAPGLIESTILE